MHGLAPEPQNFTVVITRVPYRSHRGLTRVLLTDVSLTNLSEGCRCEKESTNASAIGFRVSNV